MFDKCTATKEMYSQQNQPNFQPSKTWHNLFLSPQIRSVLVILNMFSPQFLSRFMYIYIVNHLVPYLNHFINILCVNCITILVLDSIDYWDDMHVFFFWFFFGLFVRLYNVEFSLYAFHSQCKKKKIVWPWMIVWYIEWDHRFLSVQNCSEIWTLDTQCYL